MQGMWDEEKLRESSNTRYLNSFRTVCISRKAASSEKERFIDGNERMRICHFFFRFFSSYIRGFMLKNKKCAERNVSAKEGKLHDEKRKKKVRDIGKREKPEVHDTHTHPEEIKTFFRLVGVKAARDGRFEMRDFLVKTEEDSKALGVKVIEPRKNRRDAKTVWRGGKRKATTR